MLQDNTMFYFRTIMIYRTTLCFILEQHYVLGQHYVMKNTIYYIIIIYYTQDTHRVLFFRNTLCNRLHLSSKLSLCTLPSDSVSGNEYDAGGSNGDAFFIEGDENVFTHTKRSSLTISENELRYVIEKYFNTYIHTQ